jgi:hypothetical protein
MRSSSSTDDAAKAEPLMELADAGDDPAVIVAVMYLTAYVSKCIIVW